MTHEMDCPMDVRITTLGPEVQVERHRAKNSDEVAVLVEETRAALAHDEMHTGYEIEVDHVHQAQTLLWVIDGLRYVAAVIDLDWEPDPTPN